mmetsp:Transcript_3975/g.9517  ORF Transcript_3975/g.9517 Transcript_3975/m.9517 type:complete len:207 (+) Transcript_3975:399-1019(+)
MGEASAGCQTPSGSRACLPLSAAVASRPRFDAASESQGSQAPGLREGSQSMGAAATLPDEAELRASRHIDLWLLDRFREPPLTLPSIASHGSSRSEAQTLTVRRVTCAMIPSATSPTATVRSLEIKPRRSLTSRRTHPDRSTRVLPTNDMTISEWALSEARVRRVQMSVSPGYSSADSWSTSVRLDDLKTRSEPQPLGPAATYTCG